MNRRALLVTLGLAPAGAAIGTEQFLDPPKAGQPAFGTPSKESIARALRALADEVENSRALPISIDVSSRLSHDDFMVHTIRIDVAMVSPAA